MWTGGNSNGAASKQKFPGLRHPRNRTEKPCVNWRPVKFPTGLKFQACESFPEIRIRDGFAWLLGICQQCRDFWKGVRPSRPPTYPPARC